MFFREMLDLGQKNVITSALKTFPTYSLFSDHLLSLVPCPRTPGRIASFSGQLMLGGLSFIGAEARLSSLSSFGCVFCPLQGSRRETIPSLHRTGQWQEDSLPGSSRSHPGERKPQRHVSWTLLEGCVAERRQSSGGRILPFGGRRGQVLVIVHVAVGKAVLWWS